jgi:heme/copper-type cytochrome/quinol oxidase subunit 3
VTTGLSLLVFLLNAARSLRSGRPAGPDPWDGRTLEWAIASPPPVYNFATIPVVRRRDALWRAKHPDARGPGLDDLQALTVPRGPIHLPDPSAWPLLTALAMVVLLAGALVHVAVVVVGGLLTVAAVFALALEHLPPRAATPASPVPAAPGPEDPSLGTTGLDSRKVGMWAFIGSECLFFGILVATYLVYKGRSLTGPTPHEVLNIPLTSLSTFDLLMSSLTMVLAVAAIQRGDVRGARPWLLLTITGGLVFLGFQVWEFATFLEEGLGLTTNLFASTFYVMVGFHGIHVAVGVAWLSTLWVLAGRERLAPRHAVLVDVAGLYWHFVDVVWIVIFTFVYLIQ